MPLTVTPLVPTFVAQIDGLDLRESLSGKEIDGIRDAQSNYGVLVFHQQQLSGVELVTFAAQLGPLQRMGPVGQPDEFVLKIANLDKNARYCPWTTAGAQRTSPISCGTPTVPFWT